jgi:hypothetical protein
MDVDTGVFESHTEYSQLRSARQAFRLTTEAYLRTRSLSPLVAYSYDDAVPSRKLGPAAIEFIADVENATKKALGGNQALLDQWQQLVYDGANVPNSTAIIGRCGRPYRIRKLLPWEYFRTIKQGRKRHANGAPQAGAV